MSYPDRCANNLVPFFCVYHKDLALLFERLWAFPQRGYMRLQPALNNPRGPWLEKEQLFPQAALSTCQTRSSPQMEASVAYTW